MASVRSISTPGAKVPPGHRRPPVCHRLRDPVGFKPKTGGNAAHEIRDDQHRARRPRDLRPPLDADGRRALAFRSPTASPSTARATNGSRSR